MKCGCHLGAVSLLYNGIAAGKNHELCHLVLLLVLFANTIPPLQYYNESLNLSGTDTSMNGWLDTGFPRSPGHLSNAQTQGINCNTNVCGNLPQYSHLPHFPNSPQSVPLPPIFSFPSFPVRGALVVICPPLSICPVKSA